MLPACMSMSRSAIPWMCFLSPAEGLTGFLAFWPGVTSHDGAGQAFPQIPDGCRARLTLREVDCLSSSNELFKGHSHITSSAEEMIHKTDNTTSKAAKLFDF